MILRAVSLFLSLAALACEATPIPIDRLPPNGFWNPGVVAANGTTYRQNGYFVPPVVFSYTNNVTQFGAIGDGVHDDTTNIQNCINASANCVVYFPPGTYKTTGTLTLGNGNYPWNWNSIKLQGASPTNTFILGYGGGGPIIFATGGGLDFGGSQTTLIGTAHRGDTVLYVTNWSNDYNTETFGAIYKQNSTSGNNNLDGGWTFGVTNLQAYEHPARSQMFRITGYNASANAIGIDPPLYTDWTNTTPTYFTVGLGSDESVVGIEDLSIQNAGGGNIDNIKFSGLKNSWIRNCESYDATGYHIRLSQCLRCTVEGCYIHHYYPAGGWAGGNSDYGVDCIDQTSDCLIINNHFDRCRHSEPVEYGACGNVYAYNFTTSPVQQNQESGGTLSQSELQHGGTQWNLWEGDMVPNMSFDDVLGGSTNNFVFRDCFTRITVLQNATNTGWGVDIQCNNGGASVVGCVNCVPILTPGEANFRIGAMDPNGNWPTNYAAWSSCPTCDYFPYPLGYAGYNDVGASTFVHGFVLLGTSGAATATINWNQTNNWNDTANWTWIEALTQTNTVIWTTSPAYDTNLPASLWLAAGVTPVFLAQAGSPFPGNGPDVVGFTNTIPSMTNYFGFDATTSLITTSSTVNYSLTVNNGTGSSAYPAGSSDLVNASPPAGYQFAYWSGDVGMLANTNLASTIVTMPATNITITANFVPFSSTTPPATTINGPVAWYALDDGSGAAAADSSGSGNTGTLVNSPAWTNGIIGSGALSFNGNNQFVSVPKSSRVTLAGLNTATVSAWIKTTAGGTVVSSGGACINYGNYALSINGGAAVIQFVNANSSSGQFSLSSTNSVNDGQRHLITGVLNGTSMKFYVDGALNGSRNDFSGTIFNDGGNSLIDIGATGATGECGSPAVSYFNGIIDDVRIYNRALAANEIQSLYRAAPPIKLSFPWTSGPLVILTNATSQPSTH